MTTRKRSRYILAVGIWTLLVAVLLVVPGDEVPYPGLADRFDKPAHALLFTVHFVLLAGALAGGPRASRASSVATAALGSGLYALLMEAVQLGVPGRGWDWWDLAADLAGIGVAALLLARWRARLVRSP